MIVQRHIDRISNVHLNYRAELKKMKKEWLIIMGYQNFLGVCEFLGLHGGVAGDIQSLCGLLQDFLACCFLVLNVTY